MHYVQSNSLSLKYQRITDLEIGKFITESDFDQKVIEDIFSNSTLEWLNLDAKLFV